MLHSIRGRVVIFAVSIALCWALTLSFTAYYKMRGHMEMAIYEQIHQSGRDKVAFIESWVRSRQAIVSSVLPFIGQDSLRVHLDQAQAAGDFEDMYVGQADKQMLKFSKGPPVPEGYDPTLRPWYQSAAQQYGPSASAPYMSVSTKRPILSFTQSHRVNGSVVGVAGGNVVLSELVDSVLSIQLPGKGYAALLTSEGTIIAHPMPNSALKKIEDVLPGLEIRDFGEIRRAKIDNKTQIITAYEIDPTGWFLVLLVPEAEAMLPLHKLMVWMGFLLIFGIVSTCVLMYFGLQYLLRGVVQLKDAMTQVASGHRDLSVRLHVSKQDEIAEVSRSFNLFAEQVQSLVREVKSSSQYVHDEMMDLSKISHDLSEGAKQQHAEADQIATSITELAASARDVMENTTEASSEAAAVIAEVKNGRETLTLTSQTIRGLNDLIRQGVNTINSVNQQSQSIGGVLEVIRGIAEQTNLLALNAAIEAARAGESGRGFAVVADEVRSLANKTQQSTEKIQGMIHDLHKGTSDAVSVIDSIHERSGAVVERSAELEKALEIIETAADHIHDMSRKITDVAREQTDVSQAINKNFMRILHISAESADKAEAVNEVVDTVRAQSDQVSDLIADYRV